jgi:type II secretory pathway pseudopilin PulG
MEIIIVVIIVVLAVAAVLVPLLRRGGAESLDAEASATGMSEAEIERQVDAYRAALRAGTLCRRCGAPNPGGSRFCHECGRRLRKAA